MNGVLVHVPQGERTMTNFEGQFSLSAEIGDSIIIELFGFKRQGLVVQDSRPLSVSLRELSTELQEIVITGYGLSLIHI